MPLRRSRSTAVREAKEQDGKNLEAVGIRGRPSLHIADQKRPTIADRPKTADERHRSFSRPRTANPTVTVERSVERELPVDMIGFRSGNDTYNFPTPSPRLPPRSATFQRSPSPSPLFVKESPAIGMALGSPSQAPMSMPTWGRSYTADQLSSKKMASTPPSRLSPAAPDQVAVRPPRPELKKKTSNWKSIREMFGRKPTKAETPEPFYKVRIPQAQDGLAVPRDTASPPVATGSSMRTRIHQRTPSMTRGMARLEARAEADLASFHPGAQKQKVRSPSVIQKEGFSPMFRALGTQRESEEMFNSAHERNDSPLSTNEKNDPTRTPRLNLDLPSCGLDRYSVMFEKLLEDPKPSLLERRQSKLPRKKSLNPIEPIRSIPEQAAAPSVNAPPALPQRSLTSPSLLKSRLSIKVLNKNRDADDKTGSRNRTRPIQRSNTAPLGGQSPLAAAFKKASKTAVLGLTPTSTTFSLISENSLPPTPNTANTALSDKDSVAIISNNTQRPTFPHSLEPNWNMVTAVPARTRSQHREPYLRVKSPEDLEKQMVQVSVARQVSVTKARRTVQHATATTKQPLRPRVVVMGGREKERKSTVVVIEGGDD
ncbi:hypothetical protein LTR09_009301 [Extremus antarcticus]|uniref:Uncharacterized protein n=1 Tax=Extremus antarcticus TaxID=702011 RepID=A0AAJ0G692_9PEZI|nr:hypothetical protein LTR09_009301 [Extremus antarcticus]